MFPPFLIAWNNVRSCWALNKYCWEEGCKKERGRGEGGRGKGEKAGRQGDGGEGKKEEGLCFLLQGPELVAHKATELGPLPLKMNFEALPPAPLPRSLHKFSSLTGHLSVLRGCRRRWRASL